MAPSQVILVTGASSGFGQLTAQYLALSQSKHIVYAGIWSPHGNVSSLEKDVATFAKEHSCELRSVFLDVSHEASISQAVQHIIAGPEGRIDCIVHNAGHMSFGPAEAFSPDQFHHLYQINCLIWISSSSAQGPSQPFLAPYSAAKAAMDSLAQTYAGTKHFGTAGKPEDEAVVDAYFGAGGAYEGWDKIVMEGTAGLANDAKKNGMGMREEDPVDVARAVVDIVDCERGMRPFRVHVEPSDDRSEAVNTGGDRVRRDLMRRIGCGELLKIKA